ncbi:MAG: sugar transferase [Deltaproteobacteria bacterium]|nr:MAG: sugar transferase [Deltaproteobacteria bacterium]
MTWLLGRLSSGLTIRVNLFADLISLFAGAVLAARIAHGPAGISANQLLAVSAGACTIWILVSTALRHYDPAALDRRRGDDLAMVTVLVMAAGTWVALVQIVAAPLASPPPPGLFIALVWPATVALRLLAVRPLSGRENPLEEVLIVGTGPMARLTGQDLLRRGRRRIVGYVPFSNEREGDRALLRRAMQLTVPIIGNCDELESVLRRTAVAEVYIAGNARKHEDEMQRAIQICERMGIPFAIPAYTFRLERAWPLSNRDGYLHCLPYEEKPWQMALKRLFDIVCSATALWVLAPLLVAVMVLIKITSRGPIFFRQERAGLRGKPFTVLKFRSMVVNADDLRRSLADRNEQTGPVFKMRADPRVTWVGRFIRRHSIDELPQLVNVLRGDMSIVGPRPPLPEEVAQYEPWQLRRLCVCPGLTCIWQVSGRSQVSFEQWMYMDMQYIDDWSLRRDVDLIFKTLPAVLTGRGAS